MISLLMVYCLSGQPCTQETLAIFPQEDIGGAICEIARPAIADAIRAKVAENVTVTFSCADHAMPGVPGYRPAQRSDERLRMIEAAGVSPIDAARAIIEKMAR